MSAERSTSGCQRQPKLTSCRPWLQAIIAMVATQKTSLGSLRSWLTTAVVAVRAAVPCDLLRHRRHRQAELAGDRGQRLLLGQTREMVSRSSNDNRNGDCGRRTRGRTPPDWVTNSARSSTLQPRRPPASTSPARPRSVNLAHTSADFGFLSTAHLHRSQEVRMERRSCDDRLKPPPHCGQYSLASDCRRVVVASGDSPRLGVWLSVFCRARLHLIGRPKPADGLTAD